MKKLCFALTLLFFCGCGSDGGGKISQEHIQKYETTLNSELKENFKNVLKESKILLEIPNFKCEADGAFIKCLSSDIKLKDASLAEQTQEFLSIKSVELRSNEIYTGENKGLISMKDYYNELFKKNKKLETSINLTGFKFSQNAASSLKDGFANLKDAKVSELISRLVDDEYEFHLTRGLTNADSSKILVDIAHNFSGAKKTLSVNYGANAKLENTALDALDRELGMKFDTQNLNFDKNFAEKLDKNFGALLPQFVSLATQHLSLNEVKFSILLDTQNALEPYANMFSDFLEVSKNRSTDEQQVLMIDNIISLFKDLTKEPVYKLDLNAKFKDILLKDYEKEKSEVVEKIVINGKDSTKIFKDFAVFFGLAGLKGSEF